MKFKLSLSFWFSVSMCLFNLFGFILTGNNIHFWCSIFICATSLFVYKVEKHIFNVKNKLEQMKKTFEKEKEEQSDDF